MIWFDAATPKYGLFFKYLISALQQKGFESFVTTRRSPGYEEAQAVLEMQDIPHHVMGHYGGSSILQKFKARQQRQSEFVTLFEKIGLPEALICGCVADSAQTAFGLGIPVILLCDTPIAGHAFSYDAITTVSKLTVPLASLLFHPFIIPSDIFLKMGLAADKVKTYDFIDVDLWMKDLKQNPAKDFRKRFGLDLNKPTILIREEEYKAHYVSQKLTLIYDLIPRLVQEFDVNLVILPRYEVEPLKLEFGHKVLVLEEKLKLDELYPFIDVLVGGGGTMNLEAACSGIPVVSTRSLHLYHDRFLIEKDLMTWVVDVAGALEATQQALQKGRCNHSEFCKSGAGLHQIVDPIVTFLNGLKLKELAYA